MLAILLTPIVLIILILICFTIVTFADFIVGILMWSFWLFGAWVITSVLLYYLGV